MSEPQTPVITRAPAELVALAIATRTDWREHDVSGAIAAAAMDGMSWEQVLVSLPRLMADPKASPRDLVPDYRDPLRPGQGVPPERNSLYAADARDRLADARREGRHAPAAERWDS